MDLARLCLLDRVAPRGNESELRIRGRRSLPELHVGRIIDVGQAGQGHWYL